MDIHPPEPLSVEPLLVDDGEDLVMAGDCHRREAAHQPEDVIAGTPERRWPIQTDVSARIIEC